MALQHSNVVEINVLGMRRTQFLKLPYPTGRTLDFSTLQETAKPQIGNPEKLSSIANYDHLRL